jgi:cytochrome P450 PksS
MSSLRHPDAEVAFMPEVTEYAPFSPDFKANPFPFYAQLRAERPVYQTTLTDGRPIWLVTRYDDVVSVLRDPRFVKDPKQIMTPEQLAALPPSTPVLDLLSHDLLNQDPPNHTRLRALVSKAFTPKLVEGLRPRIQQLADELLDAMATRSEVDLMAAYAFPIPITVIAELLGVPTKDQEKFKEWSNAIVGINPTPEGMALVSAAVGEFTEYLGALFAERRREPQDDLISGLVQAEEAGDRLSEQELYSMASIILIAGHETTVNLIGTGTLVLLQHPDQLARLRNDPELIRPAIEELLRHSGPVEGSTDRYAAEDVELSGVTIPKGGMVYVMLGSANRDGERFSDPDDVDLTRDTRQHVAFGQGIHYCLGAPLARLEGQIAIGSLIRRFPNLRLAAPAETLTWRPGMVIRSLHRLPVAL